MKKAINLIFPHQLFAESPLLSNGNQVYLIEEYLFFKQYPFHKQKIAFHRATMKSYQHLLESKGIEVNYIESNNKLSDLNRFIEEIKDKKILIGNNLGKINGWISSDDILAKAIRVED